MGATLVSERLRSGSIRHVDQPLLTAVLWQDPLLALRAAPSIAPSQAGARPDRQRRIRDAFIGLPAQGANLFRRLERG